MLKPIQIEILKNFFMKTTQEQEDVMDTAITQKRLRIQRGNGYT